MIHDTQSAQISQKQDGRNICNHENNVPCRLSPQWLCSNSCTWAHDVYHLSIKNFWILTPETLTPECLNQELN